MFSISLLEFVVKKPKQFSKTDFECDVLVVKFKVFSKIKA